MVTCGKVRALVGTALAMCLWVMALCGIAGGAETHARECANPARVAVRDGRNPLGSQWHVVATVRNQDGCRSWLLGWEFLPSGDDAGSWRGAWSVSAGDQFPSDFGIQARDEYEMGPRAFSGVVGADVTRLVGVTSSGRHLVIHPRLPSSRLRDRFPWLRGARYFIRFYGQGQHVKLVRIVGRRGGHGLMVRGLEGEFVGGRGVSG
jgi:hypothetical protein